MWRNVVLVACWALERHRYLDRASRQVTLSKKESRRQSCRSQAYVKKTAPQDTNVTITNCPDWKEPYILVNPQSWIDEI